MPRIACLLVPDLPVAALCRADPDLIDLPLVVTEGGGPQARVVAAAHAAGVRPGIHTAAQARTIVAGVVVRTRDLAAERSAMAALAHVAASITDRIEIAGDGAIYVDMTGVRHLVESEAGLATALVARAARVGLAVQAGVGASMTVARFAARHGDGGEVVPAGAEQGFLAPLPLACLAPPADVAATLARWGIHRLGDLARLPAAEVTTRLGPAGAALVRAARGEDARPLAPSPMASAVEEAVSLEWALDTLEPLLFVLRGLIERVTARLGLDGIGCTRLGLALGLDDPRAGARRDVRDVPLAAPTRDAKTLLVCLRVALEAAPPRAAVTTIALSAVPARIRATQLGLFAPPGPAPERLATTLAQLAALCGPDRVGAPVPVDTHRPGAAAVAPFAPHATMSRGDPASMLPAAAPHPGYRLVVRVLRPPRPVDVFTERDVPAFVRGPGFGGRVVGVAGPWRLAGEWWSERPLARDYYDFELSDGGIYRCYHELGDRGRWLVDGVYD